MFLLQKKRRKPCYLSQTAGLHRFFNTFIKIITPPPFLRAADFRVQRYEEKPGNSEKIMEIRRKSEKFREKSEKNGEIRIKIG